MSRKITFFERYTRLVWSAVARKLCVALWHVLMGHVIGALERLDTLETKLSKFATEIGPAALRAFGYNNKAEFVERKLYVLRSYP